MEPMFPEDDSGKLTELALELLSKSARLSGTLNPITLNALAYFIRPMNSYYSNLIEGHDTHPIDIARALKNDYSKDKLKRELQLEAKAHILLNEEIGKEIHAPASELIPSSSAYLKSIHRRFYERLPESFKEVYSKEGEKKMVEPGCYRLDEVEVGRHIGPWSKNLNQFMDRFEEVYDPKSPHNKAKVRRIIAIAASHHRLAWIHPFLDGNGRVVRLYSDACFAYEEMDAFGLWSISRGLARNNADYKAKLANADLSRYNDYDGRGNLSNKMLHEFCVFFLSVAIDQVDFMFTCLDTESMLSRMRSFCDLMAFKNRIRPEAKHVLIDVFLKGKITKSDAMRITNTSDKTLKAMMETLIEMELISASKEGIHMVYYARFPVKYSPFLFPGMYPSDKELEMLGAV